MEIMAEDWVCLQLGMRLQIGVSITVLQKLTAHVNMPLILKVD